MKNIVAVLTVLYLVVFVCGCDPKEKTNGDAGLQEQVGKLTGQVTKLQESNKAAEAKTAELQRQVGADKTAIDNLEEQVRAANRATEETKKKAETANRTAEALRVALAARVPEATAKMMESIGARAQGDSYIADVHVRSGMAADIEATGELTKKITNPKAGAGGKSATSLVGASPTLDPLASLPTHVRDAIAEIDKAIANEKADLASCRREENDGITTGNRDVVRFAQSGIQYDLRKIAGLEARRAELMADKTSR